MEWPAVDERTCTGCGDCVLVCPTDCLTMTAQLPALSHPARCISCMLCVLVCPVDAITMREEEWH